MTVNGSDGLAVTNRPVGQYSDGLLVSHDEPERGDGVDPDRDPTNFSYVSWGSVAETLKLKVDTTASNEPRFGGRARLRCVPQRRRVSMRLPARRSPLLFKYS
jgi:hypothetical protein